jgi:hypothetical protein
MKLWKIVLFVVAFAASANAQEKKNLFKDIYKDFLKYGTIYIAGDIDNPKEEKKDYFVRTPEDGSLVNNTMMEQKVM